MSDSEKTSVTPEQVDEVPAEFGVDHRRAIAALLHDLAVMAPDYDASISLGYLLRDPVVPPRVRRSRDVGAVEFGYDNPAAFTAMFQRALGALPRAYIQQRLTDWAPS